MSAPAAGSAPDPVGGARALVTGASSGIGAALAVALARAGATVGICARRADRLEAVLDECRMHAPASRMWVFDVGDLDAVPAFAAMVEAELGGVDLLVNNAGIPKRRRIPELSAADLDEVMRVNFFAPVALVRALLPGMLERGRGRIVNLSSMGAHSAAARVGAYAASKGALELYTEALHLDLVGTGVDAHLFVPGTTRTEFSLPREGNDPPFGPPAGMEPDAVAAAILAQLRSGQFEAFASEEYAAIAASKRRDPNEFLAAMAAHLAPEPPPTPE
ncbi:MAG: SDR family NAD(P)-dependent oxidoreductase [Acidimicrobiia bacterium]